MSPLPLPLPAELEMIVLIFSPPNNKELHVICPGCAEVIIKPLEDTSNAPISNCELTFNIFCLEPTAVSIFVSISSPPTVKLATFRGDAVVKRGCFSSNSVPIKVSCILRLLHTKEFTVKSVVFVKTSCLELKIFSIEDP